MHWEGKPRSTNLESTSSLFLLFLFLAIANKLRLLLMTKMIKEFEGCANGSLGSPEKNEKMEYECVDVDLGNDYDVIMEGDTIT